MASGSQRTILVVEDNGALRRLVARVLTDRGFLVIEAATGPQGLELVREQSQSLALAVIDMVMPGMSGLDVAAELHRERPDLKILYISGYVASVAMESISQRSPDSVLLKPFDAVELLDRVLRLLDSESPPLPAGADTISPMTQPAIAWDRLIEASDPLQPGAVEVIGYKNTGAAFAVAAAHSAALRAAAVGYAFRATNHGLLQFGLFVASGDAPLARELIGRVGLGVDVEQVV